MIGKTRRYRNPLALWALGTLIVGGCQVLDSICEGYGLVPLQHVDEATVPRLGAPLPEESKAREEIKTPPVCEIKSARVREAEEAAAEGRIAKAAELLLGARLRGEDVSAEVAALEEQRSRRREELECALTLAPKPWNTADVNPLTNGNIALALELLDTIDVALLDELAGEFSMGNCGHVLYVDRGLFPQPFIPACAALCAPWKYYGKLVACAGTVAFAEDQPPGSDLSILVGGEVARVVLVDCAPDKTVVEFLIKGSSAGLTKGQSCVLFGLPVGRTQEDNISRLFLVGKR